MSSCVVLLDGLDGVDDDLDGHVGEEDEELQGTECHCDHLTALEDLNLFREVANTPCICSTLFFYRPGVAGAVL